MLDYQIQNSSKRCSVTGRELKPGEPFFSVLLDQGGRFLRQDFSKEAWQGPPPGAFSFWSGKIPVSDKVARPPIDDDLLMDCFERLAGQTDTTRANFRFVLALMLMRRRRLKFEDVRGEAGQEILRLRCGQTKKLHEVLNPTLTEDQMATVQAEVFEVLGWQ